MVADDVLAAIDPTLAPPRLGPRDGRAAPGGAGRRRARRRRSRRSSREEAARLAATTTTRRGRGARRGGSAVLAPGARVAELRARVLPGTGDGSAEPDLDAPVVVLPVSAAKGLEFDAVVLVEPAELLAESPRGLNDLYVALTRATQRLTVVHAAPLPAVLHRARRVGRPGGQRGWTASTRARTSRMSVASSSGCHWTPTTNRCRGSSRPSRPPRRCRRRPSPSRPGPARAGRRPGGGGSARARAVPTAAPTRLAGSSRTSTSLNTPGLGLCPSWPTTSGRCWCSVPPNATFSSCAPRQTPSTGTPSARARSSTASSAASRSGVRRGLRRGAGRRRSARGRRRAAAEQHRVDPVDRVRRLDDRGQQRRAHRPRRARCRRRCG